MRDSRGGEIHLEYDEFSNIRDVRDGQQLVVSCRYDKHNRLVERTEPDGRATYYTWNPVGLLTCKREPSGTETRIDYRWKMQTAEHVVQGTFSESTRFDYDNEQRLVGIRLPDGSAFKFLLDQRGRMMERQEPSGRRVRFEYDAASRVIRERCGSHLLEYEYDDDGELAALLGHDDQAVRYEYDPFGTLVRAICGPHENLLEYDAKGRLIRETADGQSLEFQYSPNGRRTGIVPSIGARLGFGYFADGSLKSIAAGDRSLVSYARDEQGRIVQALFGNGVVEQHTWDSCSRLSHWELARPQEPALRQRGFSYDVRSQLTSVIDAKRGRNRFNYTSQGWVEHQMLAGDSRGDDFDFDAQGNFLTLPGGRNAKYGAGDRLLDDGDFTYEYDELGRIAARLSRQGERTTYGYDFRNLMTRLARADGSVVEYEYDAFSRRVAKTDGGVTTHYLWDGDQLLASWTSQGKVQQYVLDPYRWTPVAQLEMSQSGVSSETLVQFCHADHLGSVTELTSDSGQVVWSVQYDALGNTRQLQGTAEQTPLRRPGQYYDAETGWYYNRYRYYDPATSRFTTPDPIDVNGGPNLYRYPGSATNTLDLLGLFPTALVDNNFLVSLEAAEKSGMKKALERQLVKDRLGVSPTAYKEFTQAPGFSPEERARRQKLLKKYNIERVELACAAEQNNFNEAYARYRMQGLDENDAAIAAHAHAKGLPLLSENVNDFGRNLPGFGQRVASQSQVGIGSRGAPLYSFVFR
jgi:RHS repeat-associated protein